MLFIKKPKVDVDLKAVDMVVKIYFRHISENNISLTYAEISELLRYSVCKVLGLSSSTQSVKLDTLSSGVVKLLEPIVSQYDLQKKGVDYRQGFLEACVHCMEMSRKKVEA